MIEELASDYSDYLRVDLKHELSEVQDTIDDMLLRLDEFENLVNMVKTDNELCSDVSIPVVLQSKEKLESLFRQVDALERFINIVKSDVDKVEAQVKEAEEEMGQNSGSIKKLLKPLLLKMSPNNVPTERPPRRSPYEAPTIFSTSSFFPSKMEKDAVQKDKKS